MVAFIKSLSYALKGIREVFLGRNFRIEVLVGFFAILASFAVKTSLTDKEVIVLCIGLVLGSETINTAAEQLADFVSPGHRDEIRRTKDLMAAAVLIFSIMSLIIGIIILGNALFHV
jgi:undecaprenol kinase/diacylglycerol kinase (ATP)